MATIAMGVGTAHSPVCSEDPRFWGEHGKSDLRNPELPELQTLFNPPPTTIEQELTSERFHQKYEAIQRSIEVTRNTIVSARPDVLVVVGDDQDDLFLHTELMPALAIYAGESFNNPPRSAANYPDWYRSALWGHYPEDEAEIYPGHPELAEHVVRSLIEAGFDPTIATNDQGGRHVGHAFTFINRRLVDEPYIPMVPVMLNTYFPPNQPSARRCEQLGLVLADAINNWDSTDRVVIIASGGLTHPLLDEALDREFIEALETNDIDKMVQIEEKLFRLGTSELKNWITVAAAMATTTKRFKLYDYVPVHRSAASTGCGITFGEWS